MNILETIGNTPLVEIKHLNPNPNIKILAKLEKFNPSGSVKDRIALRMIEDAEKTGRLTKDKIILEATSGNTGISLALVAAVKGYPITIFMSDNVSIERRKILRAFGAKLILTPGKESTDGAIIRARRLAKNPKYVMLDQFKNPSNVLAHYRTTGPEIWKQTGGETTHFVAAIGTTGTLMGISRFLKEKNANLKIIGVEPGPNHKIQGLKNLNNNIIPEILNLKDLDKIIRIKDKNAFETARKLAREEGIFVGMSSGAAMWVAMKVARSLKKGIIVVLFPDGGEKYLYTNLFDETQTDARKAFK